tara:strand:+ start:935 stop:2383 length:1449 start_codon:yes stop_codon:yes gene_type:complete
MKVIIVGGGTAGWMTAAALSKGFPEYDITIFKGDDPIGVGESTTPHIQQYLNYMGIDDATFLKAARATYKSSSRFEDFYTVGHSFHYPNGQTWKEFPSISQWMQAKAFYPEHCPPFADTFMPFVAVAAEGKMPVEHSLLSPYDISQDRSFHIDGSKFSAYLQENFCSNVRVDGRKVKSVRYAGRRIASLFLERGPYDNRAPQVDADLYIDCTGQASTLGGAMSTWIPFDSILTDSAIIEKVDYTDKDKEMVPYTNAKGMWAGWQWTIPTWDYISRGYVFSSKYRSVEGAREESGLHEGKHITFRNGRYDKAWVGNCVSIGLSYGFIEPLESTSLFNTHHGILALVDTLKEGVPGSFARDRFNYNLAEHMDGWKEFVEAHYYYSSRRDSPFWEAVTNEVEYDIKGAHQMVQDYMVTSHDWHVDDPIVFILAGSEYSNINTRIYPEGLVTEDQVKNWSMLHGKVKTLCATMPTMHKYLKDTIFS